MARQMVDQETQVANSDLYDDQLTPGAPLQNGSQNLLDDLNAKRTQLKRVIHGENPGHWYDDPVTIYGVDISLQSLYHGGAAGLHEDDIVVLKDSTIAISKDGNVIRRQ